jgi:hypothetical protein
MDVASRLDALLQLKPDLSLPEEGFILELELEDIQLVEKQSGGLQVTS